MDQKPKRAREAERSEELESPSKRAKTDPPALPPELWDAILRHFVSNPACKWKDRLGLMLVCKQWNELVWHQCTSLDLYTGKLPSTFLPVVARNAAPFVRSVYYCALEPAEFQTYAPLFPYVQKLLVPLFKGLTNAHLKCIASFTSLVTLALFSYDALPMDEDIISTLTSLPSLMHLYLPHRVTDEAIHRIFITRDNKHNNNHNNHNNHNNNKNKELENTQRQSMLKLQALLLMTCDELTDEGYMDIGKLSTLTELDLMGCVNITELGLYPLLSLPKLTKLRLREFFIFSDSVMESLCQRLSIIADLTLENMDEVTDTGFSHFSQLNTLVSLTLKDGLLITDLKPLSMLPSLMSLQLKGFTNLMEEGLTHLPELNKSLVNLELDRCSGLTIASMQRSLSPLTNLRTLALRGNNQFNSEGLRFVLSMPSLTSLVLSDCHGVSNSFAYIIASHPSLTSLFVRSCGVIGDEFLKGIGGALSTLTELHLGKCGVTDEGLKHLSTMKSLRHIDLWECNDVSSDGVVYLSSLGLRVVL